MRSDPAVKWMPMSQPSNQLSRKRFLLALKRKTHFSGAAFDDVAGDLGGVGVVEQQALVAIAEAEIAPHLQAVRIHDGVAGMVADGDVAGDLAVVRVHVVDGEAQVAKAVAAEDVLAAGDDVDAVAAIADVVADHRGAGRVPDLDAVAGLAHPQVLAAGDDIAAHDRVRRAVDEDADQVVLDAIALDQRAGRALRPGRCRQSMALEAGARAGDRQAADDDVGRGHA